MAPHIIESHRFRSTRALTRFGLVVLLCAGSGLDAQSRSKAPGPSALSSAARAQLFTATQLDVVLRGTAPLPCDEFAPGQVVVRFDAEVDTESILRALDELQLASYRALSPLNLYVLRVDVGSGQDGNEATLALLDAVLTLGLSLPLQASVDCFGQGSDVDHQEGRGLPSDTHVGEQWHLHGAAGVDATEAWQITTGSEEVIVAIVDSGYVPDHPEFGERIYRSPFDPQNDFDDDSDGYEDDETGWDFVGFDEQPEDEHRHGSWVAGLFGAAADNGFGVSGLDHLARIMPIKVLDSTNSGFTSDLIAALDYLLLHPEVRVANLSLINYPDEPMLHDAIQALATQAILIACSGNAGPGTADGQFPGAYPETISIAWTGSSDQIAPNSSSGATVDFSAPGLDVVTVNPLSNDDGYHIVYGCSFATPLVSAAASLTLSIRPATDASDLRFLLQRSVKDLGPEGWDEDFGWGRLDVDDLLIEAQGLIFQGDFESGDAGRWK